MIALGIDPPNGWAVVDGDRHLASGDWPKRIPQRDLAVLIEAAVARALALGAEAMGIEGQWGEGRDEVPKAERMAKIADALALSRKAGMWVQEWLRQSNGKPVATLAPNEWYRPFCGRKAPPKRADRKRETKAVVLETYGIKANEDRADAIGVARTTSIEAGIARWASFSGGTI